MSVSDRIASPAQCVFKGVRSFGRTAGPVAGRLPPVLRKGCSNCSGAVARRRNRDDRTAGADSGLNLFW
jgi:hypothetical protein